jgi:hypothetical protein
LDARRVKTSNKAQRTGEYVPGRLCAFVFLRDFGRVKSAKHTSSDFVPVQLVPISVLSDRQGLPPRGAWCALFYFLTGCTGVMRVLLEVLA